MALNTKIRGLQINDAFFGAGLARNGVDGNIADVQVDDSTIEINSDALRIKDDGVTNDKLANMTQGTVKVGGAADAPTDLDASTDGYILIGDGTDVKSVAVSGDITITNAGVTTIGAEKVVESMLDIDNAPTDGYFLKWSTANGMEWADVDVSAVSDSDIKYEDESANVDGSTTNFSLGSTPVTNSVQVYLNGLLQQVGSGKDYELSGTTVAFSTAPEIGDLLLIHYITASA